MTLTLDEANNLLTLAASFDKRTIGELDIGAWQAALGRLDFQQCAAAVVKHYATTTDYLLPVHISRLVADEIRETETAQRSASADHESHCGRPSCRCTHQAPCHYGWTPDGHCETCAPGRRQRPGESHKQWMARLQTQDYAAQQTARRKNPGWTPHDTVA